MNAGAVPPTELLVPPRFRAADDWFVVRRHDELVTCYGWCPAERLVRRWRALLDQLDPAVDLCIASRRDGRAWRGELLALPDVREAIGPLLRPLATYGACELSVYTPDEQLTISASLALVATGRTDRWVYLLEGAGFQQREQVPSPDWDPETAALLEAPALGQAIREVVAALALAECDA